MELFVEPPNIDLLFKSQAAPSPKQLHIGDELSIGFVYPAIATRRCACDLPQGDSLNRQAQRQENALCETESHLITNSLGPARG